MTNPRPNPYVGPRSFLPHERLYGRDVETRKLANLLGAERIVLLHSPSGAGKTSLVQAALIPQMHARDFQVLPIVRLNLVPRVAHPNRYRFSLLDSLEEVYPEADQLPQAELATLTLAEYFQRRPRPTALPYAVLIFDQFEEILTLDPTDRAAKFTFFEELGQLLEDRTLWALFAMREDYLGALEPYGLPIPNRFSVTFRLDLLGEVAARQALQKPAETAGVAFTEAAAQKLVDDLRQVQMQRPDGTLETQLGLYVEPVQLQVVAYRLWETLEADTQRIEPADLHTLGDVGQALADYYAGQVAAVALAASRATYAAAPSERDLAIAERLIREWFEQKLITPQGIRGQVPMGIAESEGLPNTTVHALENAHLIRGDKRGGTMWYELAHDRLIEPVRANNAQWFAEKISRWQQQAAEWDQQKRYPALLLRNREWEDVFAKAQAGQATALRQQPLAVRGRYALAQAGLLGPEALVRSLDLLAAQVKELLPPTTLSEDDFLEESVHAQIETIRERRRALFISGLAVVAMLAFLVAVVFGFLAQNSANQAKKFASQAEISVATAQAASTAAVEQRQAAEVSAATAQAARVEALDQSHLAATQSAVAQANEQRANALANIFSAGALAAQTDLLITRNFQNALLVSIEAFHLLESGQTRGALLDTAQASPQLLQFLSGHTATVTSVAFSPDGQTLASSSDDHTLRLWDVTTRQPLGQPLRDPDTLVTSLAFSPDGKTLAAGQSDNTIVLWELATRQPLGKPFTAHTDVVRSVAFSPDGKWLASGSDDTTIIVWNVQTRRPITEPATLHTAAVRSVAFSPNGATLASGSDDNTVILWNAATLQPLGAPLTGHENAVFSVAFSPNGKFLASGSADDTVRLWNVERRQLVGQPLRKHTNSVLSVAFSPDSKTLASGSADNTIVLWDVTQRQPLGAPLVGHRDAVMSVAFSPDGTTFASGGDTSVVLWAVAQREPLSQVLHGHLSRINGVALSPNGHLLASGSRDATVGVWDLKTSQPITLLTDFTSTVVAVAFSPDGATLAAGGYDDVVFLWDVATLQRRGVVLYGLTNYVNTLAFSPDGKILAAGGGDKTIRLWDVATGAPIGQPLRGHTGPIYSIAFSPDGKLLASGSEDKTIILWEVATQQPVGRPIADHKKVVRSVAFSPDGQLLASSGDDRLIFLQDVTTRQNVVPPLGGHSKSVYSLAFSPDGKLLVSGSFDERLMVWDVATGEAVGEPLAGHFNFITSVAFSADGHTVASGSYDTTARVWNLDPQAWIAQACQRAGRNFTRAEWDKYGFLEPYRATCAQWPVEAP